MKKNILYPLVVLLFVSACRKEKILPEPEITDPHFYMTCDMDGSPLRIEAGNDDYYMNSSWYHEDSLGIYVYKGNLAKQNGSGYQVTILINDYMNTTVNAMMKPDSALNTGDRLYFDQNQSGFMQKVVFTPIKPEESSASYSWDVSDGVTTKHYGSPGENWYSIAPVLKVGLLYSIKLDYNDGTGTCSQSHTNYFRAGSPLQTSIIAEKQPGSELEYKLSYTNQNSWYTCQWILPDQSVINKPSFTKIFPFGTSVIKLKLTDKNTNDTCVSYYQLDASYGKTCDANFTPEFMKIENTRLYSSITVLLTDPSGKVYSSKDLVQPESSDFQIVSVSDYATNDKGEATKRLKVKFNCIVKNGATEINLRNAEAVVAVAYKK